MESYYCNGPDDADGAQGCCDDDHDDKYDNADYDHEVGVDKYDNADNLYCYFAEDWTLQIAPVLLEDDALFQCQVPSSNIFKYFQICSNMVPGDLFQDKCQILHQNCFAQLTNALQVGAANGIKPVR